MPIQVARMNRGCKYDQPRCYLSHFSSGHLHLPSRFFSLLWHFERIHIVPLCWLHWARSDYLSVGCPVPRSACLWALPALQSFTAIRTKCRNANYSYLSWCHTLLSSYRVFESRYVVSSPQTLSSMALALTHRSIAKDGPYFLPRSTLNFYSPVWCWQLVWSFCEDFCCGFL